MLGCRPMIAWRAILLTMSYSRRRSQCGDTKGSGGRLAACTLACLARPSKSAWGVRRDAGGLAVLASNTHLVLLAMRCSGKVVVDESGLCSGFDRKERNKRLRVGIVHVRPLACPP